MTNEFLHFEKISQTWQNLHRKKNPPLTGPAQFYQEFQWQNRLQDVTDVYLPLTNFIQIYKRSKKISLFSKRYFSTKESKRQIFIIGVIWQCCYNND